MFDPVAYINEPRWRTMSLGLERIEELLEKLGNPQNKLRFVHVAGTNGKGSTCSFIARILQEAGYKTGLFTSPYIETFEERIRINGNNIPKERLTQVTLKVKDAAESMASHPTEFELMTAVAFTYFAEEQCDIVVAEVGLGGRLDSTNVIRAAEVCVFAPISYDHCALLGNTLYEIAGEKAGILKKGVSAVSAPQEPEAQKRINEAASAYATSVRYVDAAALSGSTTDFSYGQLQHLSVQLQGAFQCTNAAVAIEACAVLQQRGWNISEDAIRKGLAATEWAGRFEFLRHSPDAIIDGAHNIHAVRALSKELATRYEEGSVVFCLGVMADKDYAHMLKLLVPLAKAFICYKPDNPRALNESDLADAVQLAAGDSPVEVEAASSAHEAVARALELSAGAAPICFCGSLYGIAAIKKAWRHFQKESVQQ